jgi:phytoene synthase
MAMSEEERLGFEAAGVITRRHWPGVYRASMLLPKDKRREICAVAAIVHMIHSAIVETTEGEPAARLELLEQRVADIEQDRLELPKVEFRSEEQHALYVAARVIRKYRLPRRALLDIGQTGVMDLTVRRFATWNSLERYCRLATGSVAVLMLGVLGAQHSEAGERALELGTAIRLTGILRHLPEDAKKGRVLVPLEDLQRFGVGDGELENGDVVKEKLEALVGFEVERTRALYRKGCEGICWLGDDRARLFAAGIAVGSCDELGGNKTPGRMTLGRMIRIWRLARRRADRPLTLGL